MKIFINLLLVLVVISAPVYAQNVADEQKVLKLNSQYDEALMKKDIAFFKRVFADDYVNYYEDGKAKDRAQTLEDMRRLFNNPMLKNMEMTVENEDVKIKTSGDLAVVTGKWANVWKNSKDAGMPQHINSGRYTAIFEKRNGKWMIVSEQITKAAHDNAQSEAELIYAEQQFYNAIQKKDREALNLLMSDEYTFTEPDIQRNKESLITFFTAPSFKYISANSVDKKFRILGDTAIKTGKMRLLYAYKGMQHDEPVNYTTVWVRRDGRWQLTADYYIKIPPENSNAETELKIAKQLFDKALENKDRAFLNRHFADEYIFTDENLTANKEQVIGYLVSPEFKHVAGSTAGDKRYLILGSDSAIETGRITRSTDSGGRQQTQMITVWVRRDGRWQVIADYFYPVAAKQSADGKELSSAVKGNSSFDTSLLRETTRVYEVSVGGKPVGDYVFAMKRDRLGERGVFRVTRTYGNAGMKSVQSSVFDARTFEPISSSSRGDTVFDLILSDGKITGEIKTPDGKSLKMDTNSHRGALLPWMYEAALTMLPLEIGFENVLPVVNPKTARVDFVGARVVGEKSIEVPAGKFDVFEVELTGFQPETIYVRREPPHIPVKQDLPEPPISIRLKSAAEIEK